MQISTQNGQAARRERIRQLVLGTLVALGGSIALALAANIRVPMLPVPMTMQTAAVLLLGATLGARRGVAAVGAYLMEGALGLPVLAGASLVGPTGGYLAGFLLAAAAVGWAGGHGMLRRALPALAVLLAGEALIYLPGVAWLHLGFGLDLRAALMAGALPFLPGEAAKLALVGTMLALARRG